MRILGIDTATDAVSAAVMRDGRLETQFYLHIGRKHSQTLLPAMEQMLERAGLTLADMNAIAVCAGPGSFTGVRIGVATASALSYVLDIPVFEVSTLDALLALAPEPLPACALLDARRDQVYVKAQYGKDIVINESAVALGEVFRALDGNAQRWVFTGDGAVVHAEEIRRAVPEACFMPEAISFPTAAGACICAWRGTAPERRHDTLRTRYLRAPQAQRALERKKAESESTQV